MIDVDAIPLELRALPQWAVHRAKVPHDPRTGRAAKSNDPATCSSFAEALAPLPRYDGLSFLLTAADPYTFTDLDHCRDAETGVIEPWAQRIIDAVDSYTEISPSGTGVHIWARATLPPEGRKRGNVELYDDQRFATMTGNHFTGTPTTIERRPTEILGLHRETFGEPVPIAPRQPAPVTDLDDGALLERMFSSRNGEKLRRLWSGDPSDYASGSEADLALCGGLAFWSGNDSGRTDALYRQSGLYAGDRRYRGGPKWERHDYRERTLRLALGGRGYQRLGRPSWPGGNVPPIDAPDCPPGQCSGCTERDRLIAVRDQTIATLQRERDESRTILSRQWETIRNHKLRPAERLSIMAAVFCTAEAQTHDGESSGPKLVPIARIAEHAGVSQSTAGRIVKRATDEWGIFTREVHRGEGAPYQYRNRLTGQTEERFGDITYISLNAAPTQTLKLVAALEPDRPSHGGARPRVICPDDESHAVLKRTAVEYFCTVDGTHIGSDPVREIILNPADEQDALSWEAEGPAVSPSKKQVALLVTDPQRVGRVPSAKQDALSWETPWIERYERLRPERLALSGCVIWNREQFGEWLLSDGARDPDQFVALDAQLSWYEPSEHVPLHSASLLEGVVGVEAAADARRKGQELASREAAYWEATRQRPEAS